MDELILNIMPIPALQVEQRGERAFLQSWSEVLT